MSNDKVRRVAYLATLYPKLSHTFIAREVGALRDLGIEVDTFSVRRPPPTEILSAGDRAELASTTVLYGSPLALIATVSRFALTHPRAFAAGVRKALRTGGPGLKARTWQLLYLLESIPLVCEMDARGVRHVHVHLANNSADIARLATHVGNVATGDTWTWSLAMHGPTEFTDVERFDLKAKVESAIFVACISDYCRSQLMALTDTGQWPKLHIVRMGIDPLRYDFVARERPPGEALRVLFVGRLVPEKAPQLLVEAAVQLSGQPLAVRVVGDGPLRVPLERQAKDAAAGCSIEIVGAIGQDELLAYYLWADIFCLPSFAEGLPVVIMEAMATGLPVVATAIAGIPELVVDGQTGRLITAGRVDLLASAIEELGASTLRATLSINGSDAVRAKHLAKPNAAILSELLQRYACTER